MTLLLIGGTSEIGNAVVRGLVSTGVVAGEVTRINRPTSTEASSSANGSVTFDGFWADTNHRELIKRTRQIVLSVGAFKATDGESLDPGNLWEMISVNARVNLDFLADFAAVFEEVRSENARVEIHLVSSVLADFSRQGTLDYSLSKNLVEKKLIDWAKNGPNWADLFVWKPAYVDTKFHRGKRRVRGVRTTLDYIEARVRRHRKPGVRYLPNWLGGPVKLLSVSPGLSALVANLMAGSVRDEAG